MLARNPVTLDRAPSPDPPVSPTGRVSDGSETGISGENEGTDFCRFTGATAICSGMLTRCTWTRFETIIETDSDGRPIVDFMKPNREMAAAA